MLGMDKKSYVIFYLNKNMKNTSKKKIIHIFAQLQKKFQYPEYLDQMLVKFK